MMTLLVRIEPEKKMDRWYLVAVQPTLLDPWVVICAWGNRRTNYQRIKIIPAESREIAVESAAKILTRKKRRGYYIVDKGGD